MACAAKLSRCHYVCRALVGLAGLYKSMRYKTWRAKRSRRCLKVRLVGNAHYHYPSTPHLFIPCTTPLHRSLQSCTTCAPHTTMHAATRFGKSLASLSLCKRAPQPQVSACMAAVCSPQIVDSLTACIVYVSEGRDERTVQHLQVTHWHHKCASALLLRRLWRVLSFMAEGGSAARTPPFRPHACLMHYRPLHTLPATTRS